MHRRPTSYLELISTFKSLLNVKKTEVGTAKSRYEKGLDKLLSCHDNVGKMEQELTALQAHGEPTRELVDRGNRSGTAPPRRRRPHRLGISSRLRTHARARVLKSTVSRLPPSQARAHGHTDACVRAHAHVASTLRRPWMQKRLGRRTRC